MSTSGSTNGMSLGWDNVFNRPMTNGGVFGEIGLKTVIIFATLFGDDTLNQTKAGRLLMSELI